MLPHEALRIPLRHFCGEYPQFSLPKNDETAHQNFTASLHQAGTVQSVTETLSKWLRLSHRKNVMWNEPFPHRFTSWFEYCHGYLVAPILQLFAQLHCENAPEIFHRAEQNREGVVMIWFESDAFQYFQSINEPICPTAIYISPKSFPDLVDEKAISKAISPLLSFGKYPLAFQALCTDLKSVIVVHILSNDDPNVEVEVVPLKGDLRTVRVLAAAYLLDGMPAGYYLNPPSRPEGKYKYWLPPRHVNDEQLSDDDIFRTHHRISDFNILKMIEDKDSALQFFRWKRRVEKEISPNIMSPGDILNCTTNDFDRKFQPPRGICYKYLPTSTLQHLNEIRRPRPLTPQLLSQLMHSKSFAIQLEASIGHPELAETSTRLHLCRILTIDGESIECSSKLLVKMFDDRFAKVHNPCDENGVLYERVDIDEMTKEVVTAEWHVRGEMTAYEKMGVAQGSLIPYFFGAHKFRLVNGHELYGILMEFVEGTSRFRDAIGTKSSDEQRAHLMRSVRHGLRVLQYSDVYQLDWHTGQILCKLMPSSRSPIQAHVVFIDFQATIQNVDFDVVEDGDDYGYCLGTITGPMSKSEKIWVLDFWDSEDMQRESWDTHSVGFIQRGFSRSSRRQDPYKFVYEHLLVK